MFTDPINLASYATFACWALALNLWIIESAQKNVDGFRLLRREMVHNLLWLVILGGLLGTLSQTYLLSKGRQQPYARAQ